MVRVIHYPLHHHYFFISMDIFDLMLRKAYTNNQNTSDLKICKTRLKFKKLIVIFLILYFERLIIFKLYHLADLLHLFIYRYGSHIWNVSISEKRKINLDIQNKTEGQNTETTLRWPRLYPTLQCPIRLSNWEAKIQPDLPFINLYTLACTASVWSKGLPLYIAFCTVIEFL